MQKYEIKGKNFKDEDITALAKTCNTCEELISILLLRGYTKDEIMVMLTNQMSLLKNQKPLTNSPEAAKMIYETIKSNGSIYIFGDYDCDGVTSNYVMTQGIRVISKILASDTLTKIKSHCPERKEGYGLSMDFCRKAVREKADLVITVDNGVSKIKEVKFLKDNGINVVITDHHTKGKNLPNAIIVNPHCFETDKDRRYLAGVGVAFDVIKSLNKYCGNHLKVQAFYPAVALGTIADVMPISPENCATINAGLYAINNDKTQGVLKAFRYQTNVNFTAEDLAWTVGPMINAAGRMGNTRLAANSFFVNQIQQLDETLDALEKINKCRKDITKKAEERIKAIKYKPEEKIRYFLNQEFPHGISGIIAGRLTDLYPLYPAWVFIEKNGLYTGSIRCAQDIDLLGMFAQQKKLGNLETYAGHTSACVISIKKEKLRDFIKSFSENYPEIEESDTVFYYDDVVDLKKACSREFYEELNRVPYGRNEKPTFRIKNLLVTNFSNSKNNPENLKLHISDNTYRKDVWAWGFGSKYEELGEPKCIDVICSIKQNFMNNKFLEPTLDIIDILPAIKEEDLPF